MMEDVKLEWNNSLGGGVLLFEKNDLATDEGLETAVFLSLFCDRRANDDDILPDPRSTNRRGWWADGTGVDVNDRIGSRLWLLARAKTVQEALGLAEKYALEALQWLVDEDIAAEVEVNATRGGEYATAQRIDLGIRIYRSSGEVTTLEFETAWEAMF